MRWVKLSKYCELSGETEGAVRAKRKRGHFVDGVHTKVAGDGNLWVNVEAVEKWVEQGNKATISALRGA